jgi:hypothetical protein
MKLEFVERRAEYSVYRDRRGKLVYLKDAPELNVTNPPLYQIETRTLFPPRSSDNSNLYNHWIKAQRKGMTRKTWVAFLQAVLTDPEPAEGLTWCNRCDVPTAEALGSRRYGREDSEVACASCATFLRECDMCHTRVANRETIGNQRVCLECRNENFRACRACGIYISNDEYELHHKHGVGCCESPALDFQLRWLDNPPLVSDTKTVITMGAGQVDPAGYDRLEAWLNQNGFFHESAVLRRIEPTWQKKEGNFPKRLSKEVWKTYGRKVPEPAMAMIGTIGAEHSAKHAELTVMVSRRLNESASFWYHEGSCWWSSAYASRCALKTNGGFGIVTYSSPRHSKPNGRCWVLPVKRGERGYLKPTFDTMDPDGFIVFNGYGALVDYSGARVMAALAGMSYTKIQFAPKNPLYVNSGGYLVGSEEFVSQFTDGVVYMHTMEAHAKLFEQEQKEAEQVALGEELPKLPAKKRAVKRQFDVVA